VAEPRGLGGRIALTDSAREHLVRTAAGDARAALTALEAAAGVALARSGDEVTLQDAEQAVDRVAVHYDVASAFIKSIRGSDVDAALHYLARMFEAGEDPRFVARRMVISASEDIGL